MILQGIHFRLSRILSVLFVIVFVLACSTMSYKKKKSDHMEPSGYQKGTFGYDLEFLQKYIKPIVLTDSTGKAMIMVSHEWQGRVITSSAGGNNGTSYGWINYSLVESGKLQDHINAFGGEDRIWLGPEGGQFSWYFKKGISFDFENWFVPKQLDTEPFFLVEQGNDYARFERDMELVNYSGFRFDLKLTRDISMLNIKDASDELGIQINDPVNFVAFESASIITNNSREEWTKETGMPSIWILGMFTPSPGVTIVIPFKKGDESLLGPVVNDTYFGKISPDRLKVLDGIILFKGDGKSRGKIGLSPSRVIPVAGSYDSMTRTLTIVKFSLPEGASDYVNSMWEIQKEPFRGDVLNSYNDGPLADGSQMGPFYELESSSPAASLKPGQSLTHIHQTYHFQGDEKVLDKITLHLFGISLKDIKSAF